MRSAAVPVIAIVIALTLTVCTTSTGKPTGVVTGIAYACEGLAPLGRTFYVKVNLYSGHQHIDS